MSLREASSLCQISITNMTFSILKLSLAIDPNVINFQEYATRSSQSHADSRIAKLFTSRQKQHLRMHATGGGRDKLKVACCCNGSMETCIRTSSLDVARMDNPSLLRFLVRNLSKGKIGRVWTYGRVAWLSSSFHSCTVETC